ncbi:amino acid ABC transporter permease [Bacillus gaemokensis]|uniref:Amino acid ABC transporter permease n=1 Tax=Bacillus gaemokensis TaxID=574375 RepID=A0A073K9V5_9BACI|nr:amino acid ABC transporter permease [Bacillus gaemokensis]KEK23345.1 amino acid ABC transporter permease [Bacillus gaemokensis]KYG37870.1 amino acid ABC transporter permease [Bacillus gaemokensis]
MDSSGIDLLIQSLPQLLKGLQQTLLIALYTIGISTAGGIIFGIFRTSRVRIIRFITRTYIELFRSIPILVWLFLFFFGLPLALGIDIPSTLAAVIALSLWGITEIGEIVRGALQSLPKGQVEAGKSIGMNKRKLYRYVLLPQAVRRMIPATMNIFIRIIQTTSLTVLIGVTEVIKAGQQIVERTGEVFLIYGCLFVFYFLLCYPLSMWSRKLETKWI